MSIKDVTAMVLGGHGDQMVPVVSATTVGGDPAAQARRRGPDPGDGRAHAPRAAASSSTCSAPRPGTRPARPPRRWSTRSCSTRSACSPAPPTSRASTASTASTWACRSMLGADGIEQIVELDLDDAEQQALEGVRGRRPRGRLRPHDLGAMELGPPRAHGHRLRRVRRASGSAAPRRSPPRARTSSCSRAARDVLEREAERIGALAVARRRHEPAPTSSGSSRRTLERVRRRRRRSC